MHEPQFDLVVIGAGINGAGIFREATVRGLRTILIEKDDVGGATTATSSRLIHGGLRYLEHYEIPLVRESLRERERLLHAAPHLVKPIRLTLPIYDRSSRGPLMIGAGMVAYDVLSYDKTLPMAKVITAEDALCEEPGLNPEGLKAAARYYDAQAVFPERLVVENVLDGLAHGGEIRTYCKVIGFDVNDGVVTGVTVESGAGQTEHFTARACMNVSGPWVDDVIGRAGSYPRQGGGTKGSHIVVEPFPGAPRDALYVEAAEDGRPYFIIPWNGLYLIGTTDIRYDGDIDRIAADESEITYLLNETNLVIPQANLTRSDVLYTFAGVRPLPYVDEGSTGAITRRHIIRNHAPEIRALFSIIGGKLTTYRSLSEEAVDAVQTYLGLPHNSRETRERRLPGGAEHLQEFINRFMTDKPEWLGDAAARWLLGMYGVRAWDVVALANENPRYQQPIRDGHPAPIAALVFAFESEFAQTLADALLRRTMLALDADMGIPMSFSAAYVCQEIFGWSDDQRERSLREFNAEIAKQLPRDLVTS